MEQWWGDEGEQKWERRTKKRGEEREPDYWLHRSDQVLLAGNFQFNGKRSSEEQRRPSQWRPSKWPREKNCKYWKIQFTSNNYSSYVFLFLAFVKREKEEEGFIF